MKEITRIFDLLNLYKGVYSDKEDALAMCSEKDIAKMSSAQFVELTDSLSHAFIEYGIKKGDKIGTILNNRPEWNILDHAIMQIGAVQVPIYPTISEQDYEYILEQSDIRMLFVGKEEFYEKVKNVIPKIPAIEKVFSIDIFKPIPHWKSFLKESYSDDTTKALPERISSISPDDMATIIYTSGTTGVPKGVMLSHNNIVTNFKGVSVIPPYTPKDRALSFLPLCHIYERMLNYMYQYNGYSIYYAEEIGTIGRDIKVVKPKIFCAVPRVIEKSYDKIIAKGRELKGIKKNLFFWAVRIGQAFSFSRKKKPGYAFALFIAKALILSKWKNALGNVDMIVSGGASLQPRLARIFWACGIKLMEGYGLTETSPVIAVSTLEEGGVIPGTVGPPLKGVDIKFTDEGEILCKGPNVMQGYYKEAKKTEEVIDAEGWFHTGDIGFIKEGNVRITDRKKEMFKTSGGKYISPQVVENLFKESAFIENLVVIGEGQRFPAALIYPNFEHLESWCRIKGIKWEGKEKMIADNVIYLRIKREVDSSNSRLGNTEKIKKFVLIKDEWTVENGELSPTLKLKRKNILSKYKDLVKNIYVED